MFYHDKPILISSYTHQHILDDFDCKRLDEIKVKGKDEPVEIFAPYIEGEIRKLYKD